MFITKRISKEKISQVINIYNIKSIFVMCKIQGDGFEDYFKLTEKKAIEAINNFNKKTISYSIENDSLVIYSDILKK